MMLATGMKQTIDRDDKGPDRNTADHRIRKAQVTYCVDINS